jgi:hypothetical protein
VVEGTIKSKNGKDSEVVLKLKLNDTWVKEVQ